MVKFRRTGGRLILTRELREGREKRPHCLLCLWGLFWDDEKVLENSGKGYNTMWVYIMLMNCTLKTWLTWYNEWWMFFWTAKIPLCVLRCTVLWCCSTLPVHKMSLLPLLRMNFKYKSVCICDFLVETYFYKTRVDSLQLRAIKQSLAAGDFCPHFLWFTLREVNSVGLNKGCLFVFCQVNPITKTLYTSFISAVLVLLKNR